MRDRGANTLETLGRMRDAVVLVFRRRPAGAFGLTAVVVIAIVAIISPWIVPYPPTTADPSAQLLPPSRSHFFGTDSSGMDVFSRVLVGSRIDLVIGVSATLLALAIGAPLGIVSGFYRGWHAEVISRIADILQAFPIFILAMAMVTLTGQKISNVVFVIAFLTSPIYLRLMRQQTYVLREMPFVEAGMIVGNRPRKIISRYIFPLAIPPALTQVSVNIGIAILLTAGLSFVGAGVRVPTPEWGSMISIGAPQIITGQWWVAAFPGFAIVLTVLSFSLLGQAIEFFSNPRGR
jgi:peptide/nickel transport system permease protein